MAEARARRRELRRQRILNQGGDRLAVVKGEIKGEEISRAASAQKLIDDEVQETDEPFDPDSILEQTPISLGDEPESADILDSVNSEAKEKIHQNRLQSIKDIAEQEDVKNIEGLQDSSTKETVASVVPKATVKTDKKPELSNIQKKSTKVDSKSKRKTEKKKKKKKKSSAITTKKKKKKKKDLGPPLVSTEFLDSMKEIIVLILIVVSAITTGLTVSLFSPDSAWEKQALINDPRASLQAYIDKMQAPRPAAPVFEEPKPKKPIRDSKLEEALAKLEMLDEEEEFQPSTDLSPEQTEKECSEDDGECLESPKADCSEDDGECLELPKAEATFDPVVEEEFQVVDEEWPGLNSEKPSTPKEEVEDIVGDQLEDWKILLDQALEIGQEIWRSLPCSDLPYVPLVAIPMGIRVMLRFFFGFVGFVVWARPLSPDPAGPNIISKALGAYNLFTTLMRDISVFLFLVVFTISGYSCWKQFFNNK